MSKISRFIFSISVFFVLFVVSACVTKVPLAPTSRDAEVKKFSPPEDKALVYIARPWKFVGGGANIFGPLFDREVVGMLSTDTFLCLEVSPGNHKIAKMGEVATIIEFEAEAGEMYFFQIYPEMGVWTGRMHLEQLNEEEGKELVKKCKLAQSL